MGHLETIRIEGTLLSPFILLDSEKGVIEISGRSVIAESESFYKPIIEWIEKYLENPCTKTIFICRFDAYNNSFSKILFTLFRKLDQKIILPHKLDIQWCYKEDDESMILLGEDFKQCIKNAEFNFIER